MANSNINNLTAASTPLAGTETFPIWQSSATVKATIANVQAAPVSAGTAWAIPYLDASKNPTYNTSVLSTFDGSCLLLNNASRWNSEKFGITGSSTSTVFTYWRVTANGHYISTGTDATNLYLDYGNGSGFDIKTGSTVGLNFDNSGNVKFSTGNLTQGTAAKGINFTANSAASGKTSQLLNWYEEGTWTPILGADGGQSGQTYGNQTGYYTRIGNLVTATAIIRLTAVGTLTGTYAVISGLPFTSFNGTGNLSNGNVLFGYAANFASNINTIGGYVPSSATFAYLTGAASTGTSPNDLLGKSILGNSTYVSVTIIYRAA